MKQLRELTEEVINQHNCKVLCKIKDTLSNSLFVTLGRAALFLKTDTLSTGLFVTLVLVF